MSDPVPLSIVKVASNLPFGHRRTVTWVKVQNFEYPELKSFKSQDLHYDNKIAKNFSLNDRLTSEKLKRNVRCFNNLLISAWKVGLKILNSGLFLKIHTCCCLNML